jgi:hypothetical protein
MRYLSFLILGLLMALPALAQPGAVYLLAADESQVFDVRGFDYFAIELYNDSASGVLTFTANSVDLDTFTIDATVYTTEDGVVGTAFEVNDAATTALFILNLCAAINDDGVGDGTDYSTGGAHPTVTCTATSATTLTVTAIVAGSDANAIATTETTGISSWGGATLVDVVDPTAVYSPVGSREATAHSAFTTSVTDGVRIRSVVTVSWPFYRVSVTGGDIGVGVVD